MPRTPGPTPDRRVARWPLPRPATLFHLDDSWVPASHTRVPPARRDADVSALHDFDDERWDEAPGAHAMEPLLEAGAVLRFPRLAFALAQEERRFLDARWVDRHSDRLVLAASTATLAAAPRLRGVQASAVDRAGLAALLGRYATHAEALVRRLCPHYGTGLRRGETTLRPLDAAALDVPWRDDATRLHIDAFPAQPLHGARLLRVCSNVDPSGAACHWRLGEPFAAHARRYLASLTRPLPGAAWVMTTVGLTERPRSEYDHLMLQLHDHAKADLAFQRSGPQADVAFAAGSTWLLFGDQVPHAAMAGRHVLEQAFLLDVEHLQCPQSSPLHTLERLLHRPLR